MGDERSLGGSRRGPDTSQIPDTLGEHFAEFKSMSVLPLDGRMICPKCGALRMPVQPLRWLWLFFGRFLAVHPLFWPSIGIQYCPGAAPREQMGVLPTALGLANVQIEMVCHGLTREHLHIQCGCCKYVYLMECKR